MSLSAEPLHSPAQDVDQILEAALASHGGGDIERAASLYEMALGARDDHPLALHNLGVLRAGQGRALEAIELIRRAAEADPASAAAHANLGALLMAQGRTEEAEPCFLRAVLVDPSNTGALCGLAELQAQQGRTQEAERNYRRAVELDAACTPAMTGLGILLMHRGVLREAGDLFCQVLALQPNSARASYNVANALKASGRLDEAAVFYRQTLDLDRGFADAWTNLGNLMRALEQDDQALECHGIARDLRPADPRARLNLGQLLKDRGDDAGGRAELDMALMLDPADVTAQIARCMAELQLTYASTEEMLACRERYAQRLEALIADYELKPRPEAYAAAVGASQPFYLAYQGQNDRELQARYGRLICRVMADQTPEPPALPLPGPGERIRVGIVSGFFRAHSNWKIPIRGWLKSIDRSRFEVVGYYTGQLSDASTEEAEGLCDRFITGPVGADAWREAILADQPHVLIYPEIGMDPVAVRLAAQRLAQVQCAAWGHPETTGLPTVDAFLSSDLMEPEGAQDCYTEELVRLPGLGVVLEPTAETPDAVGRAELGLKDDALVFWCAQSLPKYLPQYDEIYPRIAEAMPASQFVFIGLQHRCEAEARFLERMRTAFAARGLDFADHGVILPRMTKTRFLGALGQADVLLDSPGWSGCNSTLESLVAETPIVAMDAPLMRGRHTAAMLKLMGLDRLVARDLDDYVATALGLAADAGLRARIKAQMAARKAILYGDEACVRALETFLARAIELRRAREQH